MPEVIFNPWYFEQRRKEPQPKEEKVKRRSSSAAFQDDDQAIQTNEEPALPKSKLVDRQDRISKLEAKNAALQSKLDQIGDIIECDDPECTAEEHLAEIQDVIENGSDGRQ
jgi:hypothetical protein